MQHNVGRFAGQSDLHLQRESGSCEGGAELWEEEGLWGAKIYHFYELFTSAAPFPETTQVFNLRLVKACLWKTDIPHLGSIRARLFTFDFLQITKLSLLFFSRSVLHCIGPLVTACLLETNTD